MVNVYKVWHPGIDFNSLEGNAPAVEDKNCYFTFPRRGESAPMPATSQMTAWISYSAKVPPAKVGNSPGKPSFLSSETDMHTCICPTLVFLHVLSVWLLTMAAFGAVSSVKDPKHKLALEFFGCKHYK